MPQPRSLHDLLSKAIKAVTTRGAVASPILDRSVIDELARKARFCPKEIEGLNRPPMKPPNASLVSSSLMS